MGCSFSSIQQQGRFVFWGSNGNPAPTDEQKRQAISRENASSPFSRFIGNDKAIRKLQAAAFKALGDPNHMMRDLAFAIYGPASAGKTTLARLYADTVELPFIEISPKQVKKIEDIFKCINNVLTSKGIPLISYAKDKYNLPPCVIFLDEVHALSDNVVQGLLKATEYNDCVMATESGKTLLTKCATWMIATTDEGRLFDAFRTRFSPVQLSYLTKAEISKIVRLSNPHLSQVVCDLVAHYNGRIPRKALEFARYMVLVKDMNPSQTWDAIARQVADDEGIDSFGMHEVHLRILKSLVNGPVAAKRIPSIVGRKAEEVERFVLPVLMVETEDQPSLITTCSRGYVLTDAGIKELAKRNISYSVAAA
jgi:Holliday junction resolvasome RuvABC ATP-dependent DNA helicase subunit